MYELRVFNNSIVDLTFVVNAKTATEQSKKKNEM